MKNIVVYESKYGSTERYAKWIAKELHCKISRIKDIKADELTNYDNIIFGGCIDKGSLKGFKKITKKINKLKDKNFLVFAVGLAMTEDKSYQEFKKKNFKDFNNIQDFYLRGSFNFNKLKFLDKAMVRVFKTMLKKQSSDKENEQIISMINTNAKPVDFTNKENIKPIIQAVKDLHN